MHHGGGKSRGEQLPRGFKGRARHFLFASALCFAALAPAAASAAPSAADRETARGLLQDGDKKFESKDYRAALKNYEAAHSIMGFPSTGFAVAKTRAALGLLVEARDMALDGESVPLASLGSPRKANPGRHAVSASAPGYKPASAQVDLAEGETKAVTLELEAEAAGPAPVATGALQESTTDMVEERPEGGGLSPLVYIGFGVGAAGIVTGTVTGILHLTKVSSVKDDYCNGGDECRPGFEAERDSAKTYATIANIAFGVGIAGVAVGVVGLFASKPGGDASARAQARSRLIPQIGLGSVGLRGTF
jgi:hypothetical protein